MTTWADRIEPAEVATHLGRARAAGAWSGETRAALFHDLDRLDERVHALVRAFPDDAVHGIAIKANPLIEVLGAVVEAGAGLEAASWEEVECALAAGCPPERLIFDGPAKTVDELRRSLELGLWLNADSEGELERLAALGAPGAARIGLRVNPQLGAGRIAATSTVSRGSKFGVPLADAPTLVARHPFISGLHVHTGSQGVGLALIEAAAVEVSAACDALDLAWIDVGGGLPVRYTDADPEPPTLSAWCDALRRTSSWGRRTILTELGRSVQAGCGYALSRIEAVKDVDGVPTLVVHLGADLFLRRVYRPDDWDHDMVVLDPEGTPRRGEVRPTSVAGPLCFSGDLLARGRPLPEAHPGDLLLVRDTGAYTLSMWSRHCSRGLPPVWGLRGAAVVPLFAGERPQDVVSFWSLRD